MKLWLNHTLMAKRVELMTEKVRVNLFIFYLFVCFVLNASVFEVGSYIVTNLRLLVVKICTYFFYFN